MINATAIVLAAGEGRRLGGDTPKTYLPIAGRPLALRPLDRMCSASSVEAVVLVVAAEQKAVCESLLRADAAEHDRRWLLRTRGGTRQESGRRGRGGPRRGTRGGGGAPAVERCARRRPGGGGCECCAPGRWSFRPGSGGRSSGRASASGVSQPPPRRQP